MNAFHRELLRFAILVAALCGCQRYADIVGPVEMPIHSAAGPGVCTFLVDGTGDYAPADSSATCWDGSRPQMVEYSRPRLKGKACGESLYMPEGQVRRKFGCRKRVDLTDTIPL